MASSHDHRLKQHDWFNEVRHAQKHFFANLILTHPGMTGSDAHRFAFETMASYVNTRQGRGHETWQQAWNALTGSTSQRNGMLEVLNPTCRECDGKRYNFSGSNLIASATSGLVQGTCMACNGTGFQDLIRMGAKYAN